MKIIRIFWVHDFASDLRSDIPITFNLLYALFPTSLKTMLKFITYCWVSYDNFNTKNIAIIAHEW